MEGQTAVSRRESRRARFKIGFYAAVFACCLAWVTAPPAQAAPPANDNFADAQELAGQPLSVNGTIADATNQAGEPDHDPLGMGSAYSVWYSWTPSQSGTAVVKVCEDDDFFGVVGVYTGSAVNELTKLGSDLCTTAAQVTAGSTYMVAVAGYSFISESFSLGIKVVDRPANDDFDSAIELAGGSVTGTTAGASAEPGEPEHWHGGGQGDASVWYSWTPSESGTASVDACDSEDDAVSTIAIYSGTALDSLTQVGSEGNCRAAFAATAGTKYHIAVLGPPGYGGEFTLSVTTIQPPANDNLAAYSQITAFPVNGTTVGASRETGEPDHDDSGATATVWYRVAFANTGTYIFDACTDDDAVHAIAVYSGTTFANLTRLGSDYCSVSVQLNANTNYRIAVASYQGWWGDFQMKASFAPLPANDNFAAATTLNGDSSSANGHNYGATKQAGEPNHAGRSGNKSVWYYWTPSQDGTATIRVCATFDNVLAVYTGAAVNALSNVAANDDADVSGCDDWGSRVTFSASAGTTYRIAIDGYDQYEYGAFAVLTSLNPSVTQRNLTVNRNGDGTGKVTSSPTGIDCGSTCSASFAEGTVVTLSAEPSESSTFAGWSGACSGTGLCTVTMNQARNVTATFDPAPPVLRTLDVTRTGDGSGNVTSSPAGIDCGIECSAQFDDGTVVTLVANPADSSTFSGWSGACTGTGPCQVTMSQSGSVTAQFDPVTPPAKHELTVSIVGEGSGSVSGIPGNPACTGTCTSTHEEGTRITLNANPDPGSTFSGWAGACVGTGQCVINLAAASQVSASFEGEEIVPIKPASALLTVNPRKITVKAGKAGKVKVQVKSVGDLHVQNARLCLTVPRKLKKTIKPGPCRKYSMVRAGTSASATIKFKTTAKAKGKAKLKISLVSANAQPNNTTVDVTIKPKKKTRG